LPDFRKSNFVAEHFLALIPHRYPGVVLADGQREIHEDNNLETLSCMGKCDRRAKVVQMCA
jgi:hypothetical protein